MDKLSLTTLTSVANIVNITEQKKYKIKRAVGFSNIVMTAVKSKMFQCKVYVECSIGKLKKNTIKIIEVLNKHEQLIFGHYRVAYNHKTIKHLFCFF